uniref:Uncharacterized protein n=1 Tax=Globodera rostochiensis TaxID=31243 RepID=A0A914H7R5_GLORO
MSSPPTAVEGDPTVTEKIVEQQQKDPAGEVAQHAQTAVTALAPADSSHAELAAATDKMMDETAKLDDFYQLGKYTYIVCLLAELLILAQVGNMLYMTYAGAAPTLVSCGQHTFSDAEKPNLRCKALADILGNRQKSPNFVIFAIMAWAAGDWRTLQRVSAAFATPCILILAFLSESPRFLVQCRRMADAKAAILRMHRIDGRHCDESVLDAGRRNTIMSGSIYWNLIWTGAFRYSMNLAISFGDMRFKWLGRKFAHFLSDALAATALLLYITLDLTGLKSELSFVANWSLLSVFGFCSLLYTTTVLTANELFPTAVRSRSFTAGQVLAQVGIALVTPQLFFLTDLWALLPYLVLMVLAIADAFYFQFNVDETKNRPMGSKFPDKEERILYGKFRRAKGRKSDVELLPRGKTAAATAGIPE